MLFEGPQSVPARGNYVVYLQEQEMVEVVVDEEGREDHGVEREVVLFGEVSAVGAKEHVGAEDEQVGGGGAEGEEEAHPVQFAAATGDAGDVLRADEAALGPHAVQVEDYREVLEGVPDVQALEGHVQVGQGRGYEEEYRGEGHVHRLGEVQE